MFLNTLHTHTPPPPQGGEKKKTNLGRHRRHPPPRRGRPEAYPNQQPRAAPVPPPTKVGAAGGLPELNNHTYENPQVPPFLEREGFEVTWGTYDS